MTIPGIPGAAVPLLVGREREQSVLRDHLAAALAGHGSLVLIGGEAGIGKTALADDLCRQATERGTLVLIGRCFDLTETPPYGPWVELFGHYQPGDGPPLPAAFAQRGTVGEVTSQAALLQQVQDFLTTLSARQPLVLLLDDLHWADPASLDLLRFLARSLTALPLHIIATYRVDELTRRHPLYALLPVLVREARAARLDLRPLDINALRALIAARYRIGPADATRLIAYLHQRAEGNPFFLGELLRTLEEEGVLRTGEAGWALGDLTRIRVPTLLRQVIDGRLARLGGEPQNLLSVAAVIGQDVPFSLWATVTGGDEAQLLDVVEHATVARIVEATEDGMGLRFAHALLREALYEGVMPLRRREMHRTVAETLAVSPLSDLDAVANHFYRAGDVRAAEWLKRAGERASMAFAYPTAVERLEAALTIFDEHNLDKGERGWLLFDLAFANRFLNHQMAMRYNAEAMRVAETVYDRALIVRLLGIRAWAHLDVYELEDGLTDYTEAMAIAETLTPGELIAEEARGITNHSLVDRAGEFAEYLAFCGQFTRAREIGEQQLIARAPAAPPEEAATLPRRRQSALGNCYFGLLQSYYFQGESEKAARAAAYARIYYTAARWEMMVDGVTRWQLRTLLTYHPEQVAERRRIAVQDAARTSPARWNDALGITDLQHYLLPLMFLDGAWTDVRAIGSGLPGGVSRGRRDIARFVLAELARAQGDTEEAWSITREILPDGATDRLVLPFEMQVDVLRLGALLLLDASDLATAFAWLEARDRLLAHSEAVIGLSEAQALWAAYHRKASDAERAYRHAEQALAHASDPRQPLALLAAHRLLGELETDACRFDAAREHLDQSLALADACAAPYERALTLLAMAALYGATGDHTEATVLLDVARAICTPLGAKPTLARADALAARLASVSAPSPTYPDGLSAREVEVLRLIATGLNNPEIADSLSLSVRTVERHITNIYGKIAARGRADATAYALRCLS